LSKDPGASVVSPFPIAIEQDDPGGVGAQAGDGVVDVVDGDLRGPAGIIVALVEQIG
jgi:hypothetical protein